MVNLNKFIDMDFNEGILELMTREPILADTFEELAERYSRERIFGIVRSMYLEKTKQVQKALVDAIELELPQKDFENFVMKRIKKGSRSYAENVFRTNLNTVVHEGKARQVKRFQFAIAGFEFIATGGERRVGFGTGWGDGSTRENHAKSDGIRAPVDHPVWQVLFPPLGYQCRCSVAEITRTKAEKNNWVDETGILRLWHPKLGYTTVAAILGHGAAPDNPSFGRKKS